MAPNNSLPSMIGERSPFEEKMARPRLQIKGELIERSGSWYVRYLVDTPDFDPATGKRIRRRETEWLCPVMDEEGKRVGIRKVNRERRDFMKKLDQSAVRPSSMRTFKEFIEQRFKPDYMNSQKINTRLCYQTTLGHILPHLGHLALRDITPARVQELINKTTAAGKINTASRIRKVLSKILKHAKAMQWFPREWELPTEGVKVQTSHPKEKRAITWDETLLLSAKLPEPAATLVQFLFLTGLRIGEAAGLRWKYVNLTDKIRFLESEAIPPMCIAVRENYVRNKYQTLKTPKSRRLILIPEWFAPRLAALPHLRPGHSFSDTASVFANTCGMAPIDQHNLARRTLKPIAKLLGMPWVSWHSFRHGYATMTEHEGFTMSERMALLGHATADMTNHYSHAQLERMRGLVNRMVQPPNLVQ